MKKTLWFGCLGIVAWLAWTAAAQAAGRPLLVIPARYTVVQFAADILRLRPADMVAYDTRGERGELVLHFWEPSRQEWVLGSLDELRLAARYDAPPSRVILIGGERDVPPALRAAVAGMAAPVDNVPSLRVADMANALNDSLRFTAGEWRWLAKRQRLEIVDLNADRRRYGRYGPPGAPTPTPAAVEQPPPPAPVAVPPPADSAGNAPEPANAAGLPAPADLRQPGPVQALPEEK